jgi:hypothetical protein
VGERAGYEEEGGKLCIVIMERGKWKSIHLNDIEFNEQTG